VVITYTVHRLLLKWLGEWVASDILLERADQFLKHFRKKVVVFFCFGVGVFLFCFYSDVCFPNICKSFHPMIP